MTGQQETLFAFDCGATNWRLYRVEYLHQQNSIHMLSDPQPSPLTSFYDRHLPAALLMNADGTALESYGETVSQQMDQEDVRERIREYFKPCIGAHLQKTPLPHQKRYTHNQALTYTSMLLQSVLNQLQEEKWYNKPFNNQIRFSFAYPVYWQFGYDGSILNDFKQIILACFEPPMHERIRFIPEPEGAILSLYHQGLLQSDRPEGLTLIADVGGSTTDMVAGKVNPRTGEIEFTHHYGEPHGGGLYDAELAKYLIEKLEIPAHALADDPTALISLRNAARKLKESLSRQLLNSSGTFHTPRRTITVVMRDGSVFRSTVQLEEDTFLGIARHLIADFEYLISNALKSMGITIEDIHQVVLVGGGSQLFTIVRHLRDQFGEDRILLSDNPEEIVVKGVALEYGISQNRSSLKTPAPQPTISFASSDENKQEAWYLVSENGEKYPLIKGITTLGRKSRNDVWVKDDLASRFHAEIRKDGEVFYLVDLGSTNGTYLNAACIAPQQPTIFRQGDEIRIGSIRYRLAQD
ncbi:MAG: Hsp70 family protein [Anaerolineales bacterium]|nr:Hsp70 family protein [Anaerolineales bacterium]